jgi:glycosyltransferase involved in cell wall biosynthesis
MGHEVIVVGWQHIGMPRLTCSKCEQELTTHGKALDPCRLYLELPGGPSEAGINGKYTFREYLHQYQPDVIFSFADLNWLDYIPILKKEIPWVAYFPIDSHTWAQEWNTTMDKVDFPVTYSKHAQEVCRKNEYPDVDMIYHAIDPNVYKPMAPELIRKSVKMNFEPRGMNPDSFIVGVIQTVNPRKNWDYWLRIFAEFAKDKDDVVACLITDPQSPMAFNSKISIRRLVKMFGLHKKIWIPSNYHFWGGYNERQMAEITNWFKQGCYFTVAGGEGFGLGQFQAMACNVPVVALDYTTPTEFLADGRGYLTKIGDWDVLDGIERPLPDIDDAVDKLNQCYYEEEDRNLRALLGMQWARQFTWDSVMPQWARVFQQVANEYAE